MVLTGPNGAGKTSVLEALSLLAPGAGLRGARLADLNRRGAGPAARWAVAARVDSMRGPIDVGTGLGDSDGAPRRVVRIDGRPARGTAALAEVVPALWLTPTMDRLFLDPASGRRRFLDRLVFGFDPQHAGRLAAYERALRERSRLLRAGSGEKAWLDALEGTMAASGVAVAAARRSAIRRLDGALVDGDGPFPAAGVRLEGEVESWLDTLPAVDCEARLGEALAAARHDDAALGRAAHGPHRSDLAVRDRSSGVAAAHCSTGEQKALLIAIVLANARVEAVRQGRAPILLLDEVAAHLDAAKREGLMDEVLALGGQVWFTGTDVALFRTLGERAQCFAVEAARLQERGPSH